MTGLRLAVMQDDMVLCAECVHEHQAEAQQETAGTIVHAWLAHPAGESCEACGATFAGEGTGVS